MIDYEKLSKEELIKLIKELNTLNESLTNRCNDLTKLNEEQHMF